MLATAFRLFFMQVIRFYYPDIKVSGEEHVPHEGPVLVVANHPNGLLDPLIIRIALQRPVFLLAKSTLFGNPAGRLAMRAFSAIPVYRSKDGESTEKNNKTFQFTSAHLLAKGWLALFPEGTSHSDPSMKPLKTGAARMALMAEDAAGFSLGLKILPVGLTYDHKELFRSEVAAAVAAPFAIQDLKDAYEQDEHGTVRALTTRIREALASVVLEAPNSEIWRGFLAIAEWTTCDRGGNAEDCARELAAAFKKLSMDSPHEADEIVSLTRQFVENLTEVGVDDPLSLERGDAINPSRVISKTSQLIGLGALAVPGIILGWLPYRLVRPIAWRIAGGQDDVVSTVKVLLGALVMTVVYLTEAAVLGLYVAWWAAPLTLVAGPLTGWGALRFDEKLQKRAQSLRSRWLKATEAEKLPTSANNDASSATASKPSSPACDDSPREPLGSNLPNVPSARAPRHRALRRPKRGVA